jgi:hypothetical protein
MEVHFTNNNHNMGKGTEEKKITKVQELMNQ